MRDDRKSGRLRKEGEERCNTRREAGWREGERRCRKICKRKMQSQSKEKNEDAGKEPIPQAPMRRCPQLATHNSPSAIASRSALRK